MAKFTKKIAENSENFLIKKFIAEFKRKVKKKLKVDFHLFWLEEIVL